MNLFVDTSVWSLALRRDSGDDVREVRFLRAAIDRGESVFTTGLVIQEVLQGFDGPGDRRRIIDDLSELPFIVPDWEDHVEAAGLRNACRRRGVQVGTIDVLMAQLCLRHGLDMLTTDRDFQGVSRVCGLSLVEP